MKKSVLALTLAPLLCFAGPDHRNYWDGDEYRENSSEQRDSATELLEHIEIKPHHRILDIGCGDGSITHALATKVPLGSVVGVDISPFMIDSAKKTFSKNNLSFLTLNALDVDFVNEFDTVVSFSTLQWVPDQRTVLNNVKKALKPGGTLYFQMPCEMPPAMTSAIEATIHTPHWESYYTDFDAGLYFFSEEQYARYVYDEGLEDQMISARIRTHVFPNKSAFVGFLIQWFPYLEPLPLGKKMHFLNEVIQKYLEVVPTDDSGRIYFPVKRLTVIASKRESEVCHLTPIDTEDQQ